MAKNDVEFSIGADNSDLKRDLKDSEAVVERYADNVEAELDKIDGARLPDHVRDVTKETEAATGAAEKLGDAFGVDVSGDLDQVIGKLTETVAIIGAAAAAAQQVYEWTHKQLEDQLGINELLNEEKQLKEDLGKLEDDRIKKLVEAGDAAKLQAEGERLYNNELMATEENLRAAQGRRETASRTPSYIAPVGSNPIANYIARQGAEVMRGLEVRTATQEINELRKRHRETTDNLKEIAKAIKAQEKGMSN